ncbi:MAG: sigma-70 family RNA polymerase sigma factor [Pseudomonadota bacterium]
MDDREQLWRRWALASRDGDREAYNRLLVGVADRARRFAKSRLGRSGHGLDDAEDIVQEVLVAIHTKHGTWDPDRPIAPWVDAIIRYKTLDALRRIGRRAVATDDIDRIAEHTAAVHASERSGYIGDLDRHLDALPGLEQGVVAALGLEGLTAKKCAERLGVSEVDVRVAFHRGLARLARLAKGDAGLARRRAGQEQ